MNSEERSRDWCFAVENFTSADEVLCRAMAHDSIYSVVGTRARADGTLVLQGYVYFKSQKSEDRMLKYIPRAAFVRRSTVAHTALEASQQCKESAIYEEHGALPKQGRRTTSSTSDYFDMLPEQEEGSAAGAANNDGLHCNRCPAAFRSRAGLWKHKRSCGMAPTSSPSSEEHQQQLIVPPTHAVTATPFTVSTDRDLVLMLIRENSDLKNLMIEQQSKMMDHQQNLVLEMVRSNNGVVNANALTAVSNNAVAIATANANANALVAAANNASALQTLPTGNNNLGNHGNNNTQNNLTSNCHNSVTNKNSHNKTFNLNFFLNETCKNAMNMSEFVDNINLELADLMRVGEMGYVDGISDIILKNLRALEITERPIHCTDKKRETFYVKDDNQWQKETPENQKIKQAISRVANKNYRLVDEYKRSHPDCHRSHSIYCDQYNKIIVEATGGNLDIPQDEKARKIIHKISKEVGIHEPPQPELACNSNNNNNN